MVMLLDPELLDDYKPPMINDRKFLKMHGLGNDFVVLDARKDSFDIEIVEIQAISDRNIGIGCDQILVLKNSERADVFMQIYNSDGTESGACGNGARCIAQHMMKELGRDNITIETQTGVLESFDGGEGMLTVDMGLARIEWQEIPLSEERDTLHLDIEIADESDPEGDPLLWDPAAVNVGNPHLVFLVKNPDVVDLKKIGPLLEHSKLFPEGVNVSLAKVTGDDTIKLRVWERGAGETLACGSAACAALVVSARVGATGRSAVVDLPGGPVGVNWRDDGHVLLSGSAHTVYEGTLDMKSILLGFMEKLAAKGEGH